MSGSMFDLLIRLADGDESAGRELKQFKSCESVADERNRPVIPDIAFSEHAPNASPPPYEPFEHSRPTRQLLSAYQLDWYLWWREHGEPSESLLKGYGYRILLAMETIRSVDPESPQNTLALLSSLAVGAENKDVGNRIKTWEGDLAWALGEEDRALRAYEEVRSGVLPSVRLSMGLPSEYSPGRLAGLVRSVEYLKSPSPYSVARRKDLLPFFRWFILEGDRWSRENAGCWLSELLGRPAGTRYVPFEGIPIVPNAPESGRDPRLLWQYDLKASAMPLLPLLLRILENSYRRASGSGSSLKEAELPGLLREMVSECSKNSPHLRDLALQRAISGKRKSGVRLRKTLVSRLARESARLHNITGKWLEIAENPQGEGGLFSIGMDDERLVHDPVAGTHPVGGLGEAGVLPEMIGAQGVSGSLKDGFLGLFDGSLRLAVPKAQEWSSAQGTRLVVILDSLNNMALDICDAPLIREEGPWLVLDGEIFEMMSQQP